MQEQQSDQQLENKIRFVEKMIKQLEQCLELYYDNMLFDEILATRMDIETCKIELQKLINQREK